MRLSEPLIRSDVTATSSKRMPATILVGLVAIVVSFIGIGALHALQQPPFFPTDEP